MFANIISLIQAIASAYVLCVAVGMLNRMTAKTSHAAYAVNVVVALFAFVCILACRKADIYTMAGALLLTLISIYERRYVKR